MIFSIVVDDIAPSSQKISQEREEEHVTNVFRRKGFVWIMNNHMLT
jgi:hypothetical protein